MSRWGEDPKKYVIERTKTITEDQMWNVHLKNENAKLKQENERLKRAIAELVNT